MNKLLPITTTLALFVSLISIPLRAQNLNMASQAISPARKIKRIHFSIRNDGQQILRLSMENRLIQIAPHELVNLALPLGSGVTSAATEGAHQAGKMMTMISDSLSGTTIAVD